jgi:hypothetical protein
MGYLDWEEANGETLYLLTSAEFKDDMMKRLKTRYVLDTEPLYKYDRIEREISPLCWLPGIVSMRYYVKFDGHNIQIFVDVVTPDEIANAFRRYFESFSRLVSQEEIDDKIFRPTLSPILECVLSRTKIKRRKKKLFTRFLFICLQFFIFERKKIPIRKFQAEIFFFLDHQ